MRLTIIPVDNTICIDNYCVNDVDMSWVPENVHAVQWYDTYGEIELVTTEPNINISELGIYEIAIELWEKRKIELDKIEEDRLEANRIAEEEQQKQLLLSEYNDAVEQSSDDISELLNQIGDSEGEQSSDDISELLNQIGDSEGE